MHKFRYELGHTAGETMTVAEVRAKLAQYPDDMPVLGTWEGVRGYVREDSFETELVHKGEKEDERLSLLIDVESY